MLISTQLTTHVGQCRTAEAVFEVGALPLGPATFSVTSAVTSGEGRSLERQWRFIEAAEAQPLAGDAA